MRLVIGVVEDKALELGELTFDFVEPGCIGRSPDEYDVVLSCPSSNFSMPMG
jgi:hypothetical protein